MNSYKDVKSGEIKNILITSGLFGRISHTIKKKVIPHQWEILNDRAEDILSNMGMVFEDMPYPSHCIANFRIAAGEEKGDFYGMVFQDSDLAKWIEAVSYQLMSDPNAELEKTVDDVIDLIGRAQQKDGYLNTFFIIKEPEKRWTNLLECHELYTAGHMIEAAVAYYKATGKSKLLDIMSRMVDCIDNIFGPASEGKRPGYPGHEEIELALIKMYQVTGNEKQLKLAKFFIDERGKQPLYFDLEFEERNRESFFAKYFPPYGMYSYGQKYAQYHEPIRDQKAFVGHAVRCMYMASGAVDVARLTGDEELLETCKLLYQNMIQRRMYITGGIGSSANGERFTFDYDLPNDLVYGETCASVGLMFFMQRLLLTDQNSSYADTMERALYNTCIGAMSLDGKNFFYVNPLEVNPLASRENPDKKHVLAVRPSWFGCACCPPNLARMITSLGEYIYTLTKDAIFVNLYISNEAKLELEQGEVKLKVETDYPYEGNINFTIASKGTYTLNLRIPEWSKSKWYIRINGKKEEVAVVNGYAKMAKTWNEGDKVELFLNMEPRRVYANPKVSNDVGKVAIQRGPLVYCLEEVDNGDGLQQTFLPKEAPLYVQNMPEKLGGILEIRSKGIKLINKEENLYTSKPNFDSIEIPLTFIPYYTWANRGENEMTVWVHEK